MGDTFMEPFIWHSPPPMLRYSVAAPNDRSRWQSEPRFACRKRVFARLGFSLYIPVESTWSSRHTGSGRLDQPASSSEWFNEFVRALIARGISVGPVEHAYDRLILVSCSEHEELLYAFCELACEIGRIPTVTHTRVKLTEMKLRGSLKKFRRN